MALIDSSIYLQQQAPDFSAFTKSYQQAKESALSNQLQGLKLNEMARNEKNAQMDQGFKDTIQKSAVVDPTTGAVSYDPAALRDIGKQYPIQMQQFQVQQAQAQHAAKQAQMEDLQSQLKLHGQIWGGVHDQASFDAAKSQAMKYGHYDPGQIPDQFSNDWVQGEMQKSLSAADQIQKKIDQQKADAESSKADTEAKKLPFEQQKANAETSRASSAAAEVNVKKQGQEIELKKLYGGAGNAPTAGQITPTTDPATLVPSMVPEHHQQKVFGEIEAAQNTSQNAGKILQAFDNAASKLHGVDFVPGVANADQKSLHALMGPTFKDVEGTVRQAAMDNMNQNTTPQFGDSKATTDKKRAALVGYLQSKMSAPTAKGYGIDLGKFKSTAITDKAMSPGVQMRAPDGTVRLVPADMVEDAKAAGGQPL